LVDVDAVLEVALAVLAANVRARRLGLGLSQERLAEMARLSTIYLGQLERGTAANPSVGVVASIADALGCEPADLFSKDLWAEEQRSSRRQSERGGARRAPRTRKVGPEGRER
jgi:transcriptional regulator with XRE-family HTH domain